MKSKVILSIALILSFVFLTGLSLAAPVPATDWQASLRTAVTNEGSLPPFGSPGMIHLTIPAAAGKVLDHQPKADLQPFLTKLRAEPPSWKNGIVDTWIFIVRNGLHGTPMTFTNSVVIPGGNSVFQKIIPVYCYTYRYPVPQTNAAPARPGTAKQKKLL
jgi:hypothetical protein